MEFTVSHKIWNGQLPPVAIPHYRSNPTWFLLCPHPQNRITDIHFDKSNNVLWVGTFGRGLLKLNLKGNDINRIPLNDEIRYVNSIAQDADGYIWLVTEKMAYIKVQKIRSLLICTFPYGRKVTRIIIIACTKIAMEDYGSAMTKETSLGKSYYRWNGDSPTKPRNSRLCCNCFYLETISKLTKPFMDCHRKRNNGL